jgi:hypothetical protein
VLDRLIRRERVVRLIGIARRGFENEAGCRALAGEFVRGFTAADRRDGGLQI